MSAAIDELMARSLTADELANRLLDHPDVAVRQMARYCLDGDTEARTELEEAKAGANESENERDEANRIANDAESLLDDCMDVLPDDSPLAKRVREWLASR